MDHEEKEQRINELVRTSCRIIGAEPWGLEFAPGSGRKRGFVRVFIDAPGGVTIEQCAELSRQLSIALDVEDLIPGSYNLEVSSPGIYRFFFQPGQMHGYIGRKVKIALKHPRKGRKNFTGIMLTVRDKQISVQTVPETTWYFHWDEIDKAKLAD